MTFQIGMTLIFQFYRVIMFENNSPLMRLSNIENYVRQVLLDHNLEPKGLLTSDVLSRKAEASLEKIGLPQQDIVKIYNLFDQLRLNQTISIAGQVAHRMLQNYEEKPDKFWIKIQRNSGNFTAHMNLMREFNLGNYDSYPSCTSEISINRRASFILLWAATYCDNENFVVFEAFLSQAEKSLFKQHYQKVERIRNHCDKLFEQKQNLIERRKFINSKYNETGFVFHDDGNVELMDFDIWAEREGYKKEYDQISSIVESMAYTYDEIMAAAGA